MRAESTSLKTVFPNSASKALGPFLFVENLHVVSGFAPIAGTAMMLFIYQLFMSCDIR